MFREIPPSGLGDSRTDGQTDGRRGSQYPMGIESVLTAMLFIIKKILFFMISNSSYRSGDLLTQPEGHMGQSEK